MQVVEAGNGKHLIFWDHQTAQLGRSHAFRFRRVAVIEGISVNFLTLQTRGVEMKIVQLKKPENEPRPLSLSEP